MKKQIAVTLALMVVLGAFWTNLFPTLIQPSKDESLTRKLGLDSFSFSLPKLSMPGLGEPAAGTIADEAWSTFAAYLEFARAHNLEGVKSLSYQLSPTCKDPAKITECNGLMDSVYGFGSTFKKADFIHIFSDSHQIVLMTDYDTNSEADAQPIQIILFFTRASDGTPKVLGMRFCFKEPDTTPSNCVETDPEKRDLDNNGWWDSVEALFYK